MEKYDKSCPFCGSKDLEEDSWDGVPYALICQDCGAIFTHADVHSYEDLARAWNRRYRPITGDYEFAITIENNYDKDFAKDLAKETAEHLNFFVGKVIKPREHVEAQRLIEDILDTLIEVGNGTTDKMLHEAADKLFEVRRLLFGIKPNGQYE